MTSTNKTEPTEIVQQQLVLTPWGPALQQLASSSGLSAGCLTEAAAKGAVWYQKKNSQKIQRLRFFSIDGKPSLLAGDTVYINYNAEVLSREPQTPVLVSDQGNYSIWNKPSGMLSQGTKWSDHCTITEVVKHISGKPTYLVHRLDRAASGLILVAHTKNALRTFAALFASRGITKHYTARVHGCVNVELPYDINEPIEDKAAHTRLLTTSYDEACNVSTLLLLITTGRKHQIRSHLAQMDFPIVGDRYFDSTKEHTLDLQLTACQLEFDCPFSKQHLCIQL